MPKFAGTNAQMNLQGASARRRATVESFDSVVGQASGHEL